MSNIPTFTHDEVRALKPCQVGFRKANSLLANWKKRGYTLLEMYKLGVDYADILWLMAETPTISDRVKVLFSVGCAERVLHFYEEVYPADDTLRKVLATARKYLDDRVTFSELESASRAASRAAYKAALATTAAAAWAAEAASHAPATAARAASHAAYKAADVAYSGLISFQSAQAAAQAAAQATARATDAADAADVNIARHVEQKWQMEHLNTLLINEGNL